MNTQIDPYKNFKFRIEIEGVTSGAFKNVEGLDSETEVVEHRSGGARSSNWKTAPGVRDRAALDRASRLGRPGALLLKGFVPFSPLNRLLQGRQGASTSSHTSAGSIQQIASSGETVAQWSFKNAWPCKWKGFTLDGKGTDTLPPDEIFLVFQKVHPSSSRGAVFKGEVSSIEPRF